MRPIYEILMAGPANRDESIKVREAGWSYVSTNNKPGCTYCGAAWNVWLKDGVCLGCRKEMRSKVDAAWHSDAALASPADGPTAVFED